MGLRVRDAVPGAGLPGHGKTPKPVGVSGSFRAVPPGLGESPVDSWVVGLMFGGGARWAANRVILPSSLPADRPIMGHAAEVAIPADLPQ
jgi:hypothetical protein